jgi:transcription antitermination factor NusG
MRRAPAGSARRRHLETQPWFAVRTRARAEKVVRDQLCARDIEVFLPTLTRWSRWKDRKKAVDWPLFGGYCFARFDPADQLAVMKCPAVAGIVSFCGQLAPVPDHEVESLRTLVTSDLQFDPVPFIKEGSLVEVVHGPLRGVVGRLVRKGDHARLVLSVEMISQAVSVQVDAADVKLY